MNRNGMNRQKVCQLGLAILLGTFALAQPPDGYGPRGGGPPRRGGPPMGGDGIWVRNAVVAASATFDPCNANQPPHGEYHYYADPVCLRVQLNDNIAKVEGQYRESAGPWKHSPILGWAHDGYPIYGP